MQLGATIPVADIGTGPSAIRDYAQAVGRPGLRLSAGAGSRAGRQPGDGRRARAGRHQRKTLPRPVRAVRLPRRLHAAPRLRAGRADPGAAPGGAGGEAGGLPGRAVGGRLRLGVGVGWNKVEFTGLNEDFSNRGRRSEEQVQVMQALWAQPHVTFKGRYHTIDDAGINPRPASGRIPVWFGGHAEQTLQRTAKYGDGWMPLAYPADERRWRRSRNCGTWSRPRAAIRRMSGWRYGGRSASATRTPGGGSSNSGSRPA